MQEFIYLARDLAIAIFNFKKIKKHPLNQINFVQIKNYILKVFYTDYLRE